MHNKTVLRMIITSVLVCVSLVWAGAREKKQFTYSDWWDSGEGNYEAARIKSRMAAGDFNGDGKSDIAVMYDYLGKQAKLHVFTSDGTAFSKADWWDSGKGNYEAVKVDNRLVAGDFNGDGKQDVAALYDYGQKQAKLHVFTSDGSAFSKAEWWDSDKGNFAVAMVLNRVVAGDFNGDGKDDIAVLYDYMAKQAKLLVFTSNGSSFTREEWWDSGKGNYELARVASRMVSGDFNNDGKTDIATMYDYLNKQSQIHVFTSDGSAFSKSQWWDSGKGNYSSTSVLGRIVSDDFTGDKKSDIVTLYDYMADSGRLHIFKNSDSSYRNATWWDSGVGKYTISSVLNRVVSGDFDGDGIADVATLYDYLDKQARIHVFVVSEKQKKEYASLQDCIDQNTPIYFIPNRGNMIGGENDKLWEIIDYINDNMAEATIKLSIEGHTANVGRPEGEKSLSDLRADVVRVYLRKRVKNRNVSYDMVGLGSTQQATSNKSQRQKNRRVEISIISQ